MKKRCTNPACRKHFTPREALDSVVCPHCGKIYGQIKTARVELIGFSDGRSLPVLKAVRSHLGCDLKTAKATVENLHSIPLDLGVWPLDQALQLVARWEAEHGVLRLCSEHPAQPSGNFHHAAYTVLATGYLPKQRTAACRMASRHTGSLKKAVQEVRHIRSQEVILAEGLSLADAEAMVADAKRQGVHAYLRWQRAG